MKYAFFAALAFFAARADAALQLSATNASGVTLTYHVRTKTVEDDQAQTVMNQYCSWPSQTQYAANLPPVECNQVVASGAAFSALMAEQVSAGQTFAQAVNAASDAYLMSTKPSASGNWFFQTDWSKATKQ